MSTITTDGTCGFAVTASPGILPGTVTAFSGTFKDGYPIDKNTGLVNKEWHLCDGANGTPDLRSRFIYGGDGTNNGATGGEASHTLTEAELPKITPSTNNNLWNSDNTVSGEANTVLWGKAHGTDNLFKHFNSFGGNQPHNNLPPYYVLSYIMKL